MPCLINANTLARKSELVKQRIKDVLFRSFCENSFVRPCATIPFLLEYIIYEPAFGRDYIFIGEEK